MSSHNDVVKIYDFAKASGYKITSFSIADRHNAKGAYSVAEVTFVMPRNAEKDNTQKEEVKEDEV